MELMGTLVIVLLVLKGGTAKLTEMNASTTCVGMGHFALMASTITPAYANLVLVEDIARST